MSEWVSEWRFWRIMTISRQKEIQSQDYSIFLTISLFLIVHSIHLAMSTPSPWVIWRVVMRNDHDDHLIRSGFEPGTCRLCFQSQTNEPWRVPYMDDGARRWLANYYSPQLVCHSWHQTRFMPWSSFTFYYINLNDLCTFCEQLVLY